MMINNDEQLRLVVVLNFVVTLRMISQQYQVPYQYMHSLTASSRLALLGTFLNVL